MTKTTRSTFTLAVRDHGWEPQAHEFATVTLECRSQGERGWGIPGESIEALDAALAALRSDLIKATHFHHETAEEN